MHLESRMISKALSIHVQYVRYLCKLKLPNFQIPSRGCMKGNLQGKTYLLAALFVLCVCEMQAKWI